jgi:hypothetical protein
MSEPWDVFIIHPFRLRATAEALHFALERRGLRPFLDTRDIPLGTPYPNALKEAQQAARCSVVLLDAARTTLGPYVEHEIAVALELTRATPVRPCIPIWLDGLPSDATAYPYGLASLQGIGLRGRTADEAALQVHDRLNCRLLPPAPRRPFPWMLATAGLVVALSLLAWTWTRPAPSERSPRDGIVPTPAGYPAAVVSSPPPSISTSPSSPVLGTGIDLRTADLDGGAAEISAHGGDIDLSGAKVTTRGDVKVEATGPDSQVVAPNSHIDASGDIVIRVDQRTP